MYSFLLKFETKKSQCLLCKEFCKTGCPANTVLSRHRGSTFNVSYSLKHRHWLRKYYFSLVCSWVTASLRDLSIRCWKYQSPVKQVYWTPNRFAFLYIAAFCFCGFFVWQSVSMTSWKCILSPCTQPSLLLFLQVLFLTIPPRRSFLLITFSPGDSSNHPPSLLLLNAQLMFFPPAQSQKWVPTQFCPSSVSSSLHGSPWCSFST